MKGKDNFFNGQNNDNDNLMKTHTKHRFLNWQHCGSDLQSGVATCRRCFVIFLWELHRSVGFTVGGLSENLLQNLSYKLQRQTVQCCQFPNLCDHLITFEWVEMKKKERRERCRWANKWASVYTASKHTHQQNPHPEYLFKENLGPRRDHCQIYQTSYVLRAIYLCKTREEIG